MMIPIPKEKYPVVKSYLQDSLSFEIDLLRIFEQFSVADASTDVYAGFTTQLSALLNVHWVQNRPVPFLQACHDLLETKEKLKVFSEWKSEIQQKERFYSIAGDSFSVRYRKMGKRMVLKTGWLLIEVANWFRKDKKPVNFWKQAIPEAALADWVFVNRFCDCLFPFFNQLLQHREIRLRQFYVLDRELEQFRFRGNELINFHETIVQLKVDLETDQQAIDDFFMAVESELEAQFVNLRSKVGTFEFPTERLASKKRYRQLQQTVGHLDRINATEEMIFFALTEHWRLKLANRILIFKLKRQTREQQEIIQHQLNEVLKPAFIELKKELSVFATMAPVEWSGGDKVIEVRSFVKKRMPELVQLVFQSRLNILFDRPLVELEQAIQSGPEVHRFAAPVFEGKRISAKSFHLVETRELLRGSVLSSLKIHASVSQKKLLAIMQKLSTSLEEIQHTINYSVDFFFEQKRGDQAAGELAEGVKRTVRKAEENLSLLADLQELVLSTFEELTRFFAAKVLESFEPHRLHQSVKSNRRRAYIEQKKKLISSWGLKILRQSTRYWKVITDLYVVSYNRYFNLRNLLGIAYEKEPISTELSNYLSETRQAIARLPLMYQKLFDNTPLNEERFYLPRKVELNQLASAFENWQRGNFAPVCMVGEQGSGTTTILNFFTKSLKKEIPVKRLEIKHNLTEESEFLAFLSNAFPNFRFQTLDELIDEINGNTPAEVVILENIHNLFLRSSGAFSNLFRLCQLISQTNRKVFWVTSCFLYSWRLLDYTNGIAGYFAYVINDSRFPSVVLREAIMKRHLLSGFSLKFLEPDGFSFKRSYRKMNDEEKQLFLKEVFFEDLWNHAQSNISLAFIYWLRAIVQVEDSVIFIRQKHLNFSFLNSLKTPEITTLHSILIHGGFRLFEHSRIFHCSREESFRMLMVLTDDGLLEKQGESYVINPLVYRMLVSQLKSLNFIY